MLLDFNSVSGRKMIFHFFKNDTDESKNILNMVPKNVEKVKKASNVSLTLAESCKRDMEKIIDLS